MTGKFNGNIAVVVKALAFALTVVAMLIAIGISWGSTRSEIGELKSKQEAMQSRQDDLARQRQADRELIIEMRNDVVWIRKALEH